MQAIRFLFQNFGGFMALVLRLSGLFVLTPVISGEMIPGRVKGIFVLLISLVTFPVLASRNLLPSPDNVPELIVIGVGEFMVGFVIGFVLLMVITLFQVSGQFYSIQMGFGIINVFDPLAEASVPIISQLKALLLSGVFIGIGGHHVAFRAVFKSYEYIPAIYSLDVAPVVREMASLIARAFHYGFVVGLPLIGIVFLMTMCLGLLSKLVPQMNVMVMGFGLKVLVGEFVFIMLVPIFMTMAVRIFNDTFKQLGPLLRAMGGG